MKVTVDAKALGLHLTSAMNDENHKEIYPFDTPTSTMTLALKGYDARLVRLK